VLDDLMRDLARLTQGVGTDHLKASLFRRWDDDDVSDQIAEVEAAGGRIVWQHFESQTLDRARKIHRTAHYVLPEAAVGPPGTYPHSGPDPPAGDRDGSQGDRGAGASGPCGPRRTRSSPSHALVSCSRMPSDQSLADTLPFGRTVLARV